MKNFRYYGILCGFMAAFSLVGCEDDDPITAGQGDPLNKDVRTLDITVSTPQPNAGESNLLPFEVTLPQSFDSDATVTATVLLDNGRTSTGTAVVPAGATQATGTVQMPADDGFIPTTLLSENYGTLEATAILLDELEEGVTYIANSNVVDINLWADTLGVAGGLNIIFDWENPGTYDIDMEVIDAAFTSIFESSASGSRFESDLFQSAGREDGDYDIYLTIFSGDNSDTAIPYVLNFTLPDNTLATLEGTIPAGQPLGSRFAVARFTKSTDFESGVVSYTDITSL